MQTGGGNSQQQADNTTMQSMDTDSSATVGLRSGNDERLETALRHSTVYKKAIKKLSETLLGDQLLKLNLTQCCNRI